MECSCSPSSVHFYLYFFVCPQHAGSHCWIVVTTFRDSHPDHPDTMWARNIRAAYVCLNKLKKKKNIENPEIVVRANHVTCLSPDTDHSKKSLDPPPPPPRKKDKSSTVMCLPVYLLFFFLFSFFQTPRIYYLSPGKYLMLETFVNVCSWLNRIDY